MKKVAFKSLKRNKATGYDDINTNIVIDSYDNIKAILYKIFSVSIAQWSFPDKLKIAKVIPIFKTGDRANITNYRPISVLPAKVTSAFDSVGYCIPPIIILKIKQVLDSLINDAPPETVGRCFKSDWVEINLFRDFITHFVIRVNYSTTNECLLTLDGYKSQTKRLDFLNYASYNGLHNLSLLPHIPHKLQPPDRTLFKSFKSAYNSVCTTWMRKHPERRITVDKLSGLFCQAYVKAATLVHF
ncbi:uncharacterized protein LOC136081233 [Hydra vulgaris]|uniref:Uncharacterized protein LOC136081233 n=1 Tax=Hydra vulgaris TaxID=6087 RepID=A0ABM4BZC9_HYDVU